MRDQLLAALRASGGFSDPATLLVRAGLFAERPAAAVAARLVASALAGDARVEVERGMVRLVRLHAAPIFAVVSVETVTTTAGLEVAAIGAVKVQGPAADQVGEPLELRVAARGERLEVRPAVVRPARNKGLGLGGGAGASWRRISRDVWDGVDDAPLEGEPAVEPAPDAGDIDVGGPAPVSLEDAARELQAYVAGAVLVAHPLATVARRLVEVGVALPPERLCTRELSRRLAPEVATARLEGLCVALDVQPPRPGRALDAARATAAVFVVLASRASRDGLLPGGPADLPERARGPRHVVLPDGPARGLAVRVAGAPAAPGVYRFIDEEGSTIYVGASEDLRRRLCGHFSPGAPDHSARLVRQAHDVSWEECPSALEAFLREAELIETLAPSLNRRGTGLGEATYLRVRRVRAGGIRLVSSRRPASKGRTFGPFTFTSGVRRGLAALAAAFAGAEDRLEPFLERGDLALAPRVGPEVVEVARARAAVRGVWEAGTRAVRLPGGTLLLVHGDAEVDLVREPSGRKVRAILSARAPAPGGPPPDHLEVVHAARALLVTRFASELPEVRLDTLADLEAVERAIEALLADGEGSTG